MDQRQHSFCVFFCSLHQVSTVCTFYKSFIICWAGVQFFSFFQKFSFSIYLIFLIYIHTLTFKKVITYPFEKKNRRLGLCFGLLTYLVVISAMAKSQEILIPSYKDPERQAQYASK